MPITVSTTPWGTFLVAPWDLVPAWIAQGKFWDPHIKPIYDKHINKNSVCLDVGAHCGFHSIYLSKLAKEIYAFEPQPVIYRQLCGNLFLNNCLNVHAFNLALYDKECTMEIAPQAQQVIPVPMCGSNVNYDACTNSAGVALRPGAGSMKAITLDSLNIPKVDFIKCDAQGADLHVLMGGLELIKRCRPIIIFEYEAELIGINGDKLQDYSDFFFHKNNLNYEISKLDVRDHLCMPR
jgi:hypothetical protein